MPDEESERDRRERKQVYVCIPINNASCYAKQLKIEANWL